MVSSMLAKVLTFSLSSLYKMGDSILYFLPTLWIPSISNLTGLI